MPQPHDIEAIVPSAAPTAADLARWQAAPRPEQVRGAEDAIRDGFASGVSERDIDDIIAAAKARLANNG